MSEFLGLVIISISILGLTYSIGNVIMTLRKSSPELNSLHNLEVYHLGLTHKRQNLREDKQ